MDLSIAERRFYVEGAATTEPAVSFRIWKPYQPEGDYPRCAYELVTANGIQKGEVSSVDALHYIIVCLSQANTKIAGLNASIFGGRLRWEASPEGWPGLGLPTIEDHWPFQERYEEALRWSLDQRNSPPE